MGFGIPPALGLEHPDIVTAPTPTSDATPTTAATQPADRLILFMFMFMAMTGPLSDYEPRRIESCSSCSATLIDCSVS